MKELESFVKMSRAEFEEKRAKLEPFPLNAPYKKGDLCYFDGKPYISSQNTNCSPTTPGHWKLVILED